MGHQEQIEQPPRYAPWTVPAQPLARRGSAGRRVGWVAAAVGVAAVAGLAIFRLVERRGPEAEPPPDSEETKGARLLAGGAAILAFSVLADSGIEHYRGAYHNPAMFVGPTVAAVSLAHHIHMVLTPQTAGPARLALSGLSFATGATGLAFHLYNVQKREGGIDLLNLFYGAPLGAPGAIAASGLAGLAAVQLVSEAEVGTKPTLLGTPGGTVIGLATTFVMLGTVAEVALLHFRGAFHDPFMYVPVTVPPVAAAVLAAAVFTPALRKAARVLMWVTGAAGIAGAGFHAYGISRNMGGFYNWTQNILNGPPLPAPPSFTGVALAGLAALRLLEAQ